MNILQNYPNPNELLNWYTSLKKNNLYKVNGHIHTPFSFSAFNDIPQIFEMAKKENIKVLGINDFYVTDGYTLFYEQALKDSILVAAISAAKD